MNIFVFHIARPVTLWGLHFIAIYALISATCAPRELLDSDMLRLVAGALTVGAALLTLVWTVTGFRRVHRMHDGASERPLAVAAFWAAGISLVAMLGNLWPVFGLAGCGG
ncbi:MAG: hypothetical protein ACU0GG_04430 [Paracoccaceae bacterium]